MASERLPDDFVRQLTEIQDRLYAYILTMVPDRTDAREVLQEANVVMCRKFDALQPGQEFAAWACSVAFYEVRSYRRKQSRDRHIFGDELLDLVAEDSQQHNTESDAAEMMVYCLDKLEPAQRDMVRTRYNPGGSVKDIAEQTGRTPSSVGVTLFRIRQKLLECIQRRREQEDHS